MNRPHPIVVRPRKGSELERVWVKHDYDAGEMREIFHSWAEMFSKMVNNQGEQENDE